MNEDLRRGIAEMSRDAVLKLAVAVQRDLDDEANEELFARLAPEQAEAFLARLSEVESERREASEPEALERVARAFLEAVLEAEAFDEVVAQNLMDAGVRFAPAAVVGWFTKNFNVAKLLGIEFEYAREQKVVTRTDEGSTETTTTRRIRAG